MNYKIFMLSLIALSFIFSSCNDKTTNPEPANYESIKIGRQVWMVKNLDVDHYRNGDAIPQVTDGVEWLKLKTGAWCYYNNDPTIGAIYGKLYNWYAVNDPRGLAPKGWHVASKEEWDTLSNYLGGDLVAGGKLKEAGTAHWKYPNTGATNETGFFALPGGQCTGWTSAAGIYIGTLGNWWSSTENSNEYADNILMHFGESYISGASMLKTEGYSVRCIKD
jgi:uncharacterized protein (TIGR02145 family)